MSDLDTLESHVHAERFGEALATALALWRKTPDPSLGTLCARLDAKVPTVGPADPWKAEESKPGTVPLGVLTGALLPASTSGQLASRCAILARRSPDPRVGAALEAVLRAAPFTSSSARTNLGELYETIGRVGKHDPRFTGIAATLDADWDVRAAQKEWMFKRFARVAAVIDPLWPEVPRVAEPHRIDALLAALADPEPVPDTVDDLFAHVWADPFDPAARQVARDALLEAGDPRGELIALQESDADPARQQALIEAHATEWLGELAPFATVTEWRLGFPWAAEVRFRQPREVTQTGVHPAWRTFGDIRLEGDRVGPMLQPFLENIAPTVTILRTSGPALSRCLPGLDLQRLHTLELSVADMDAGRALAAHPLPALRHLRIATTDAGWMADAVWLDGLETLELQRAGVAMLTAIWPTLLERRSLVRASSVRGDLLRGPDGRMSALRLRGVGPLMQDPDTAYRRPLIDEALAQLPDGALTAVELEPEAPEGWDGPVEALIARSTRLRRASVRGVVRTFDRDGALTLEKPLPKLAKPHAVGCGTLGVFVGQNGQLLTIDPVDGSVLAARDVGPVDTIVAGDGELVWAGGNRITWDGRWTRSGSPRFMRLGPPGLLLLGHGADVVSPDGRGIAEHRPASQYFQGGDFAPDGERYALVGMQTRLRIVSMEGGRAKSIGASRSTKTVVWTEAGLWLSANDHPLRCLDDKGTVLREIPFSPYDLRPWHGGVVASDAKHVVLFDRDGREVMRTPGWRGWPTERGLVVQITTEPWLTLVPW